MAAKLRCTIAVAALSIGLCSSLGTLNAQEIPRTPSGKPDFTGNYDISTLTPWQRSRDLGDRRAYNEEEIRKILGDSEAYEAGKYAPSDPNRAAPPAGGNVGAYNSFFFDRGTSPVVIDGEYRTSIITSPANGRLPSRTARGSARFDHLYSFMGKNSGEVWWAGAEVGPYDGPETLSIADRCIHHLEATVPAIPRVYNNLKTIVQTDDHVMLLTEWMHTARVVRMNSKHPPAEIRSRAGDAIGWWEGDTLVIEATNFLEEDWITATVGASASPTADQKVVERFTPIDANHVLYEFEVTSSDFETPYSGQHVWPRTSAKMYEYACHEGNYAMGGILRGARRLEAQQSSDD